MMEDLDMDFSKDINQQDLLNLRTFYDTMFPFELFYEWLTINNCKNKEEEEQDKKRSFERREFSVKIVKGEKSFVIRNKSFNKIQELKDFLKGRTGNDGMLEIPERLDIGPVYSWEPSKMSVVSQTDYYPVSKELVFDIDVDDYNQIRSCCSSKSLCSICWGYLAVAAEFLDNYLRSCLGYEQIMYVFSGRRGLHVWVSDKSAQSLSKEGRISVVNHIRVELSAVQSPIFKKSFDNILLPHFEKQIVEQQKLFTNSSQRKQFLSLLPISIKKDKQIIKPLEAIESKLLELEKEESAISNSEIWFAIKSYLTDKNLKEYLYQIIFHYTMPKIDEPVTIGFNHLLKSPFVIHPDTKKLCVPIEFAEIHKFNPETVPTLDQLLLDPKLFNKYNQIFKNHINQMNLKLNKSLQDPMDF